MAHVSRAGAVLTDDAYMRIMSFQPDFQTMSRMCKTSYRSEAEMYAECRALHGRRLSCVVGESILEDVRDQSIMDEVLGEVESLRLTMKEFREVWIAIYIIRITLGLQVQFNHYPSVESAPSIGLTGLLFCLAVYSVSTTFIASFSRVRHARGKSIHHIQSCSGSHPPNGIP
jgi:hypothetical protein